MYHAHYQEVIMGRNFILRLWFLSELLVAGCGNFSGFWTVALSLGINEMKVLAQSGWESSKLSKMSRQ